MEEENNNIEKFDVIEPQLPAESTPKVEQPENPPEEKKKRCTYFPSAYTILLCLELVVFILTYIIPKGKFNTIEYDSSTEKFIINKYNKTSQPEPETKNATQEILDELGVKISLDKFTSGDIKKPISIPGTYKVLEDEENANFFDLFLYPILGLIDSSNIDFVLMMIGGCINLLIEMKALTSGMEALARLTKNHEIILLIVSFFLISIGGTTFGIAEEILSFYKKWT